VYVTVPTLQWAMIADTAQYAPRDPQGKLKAAIVNPTDKYKEKGEALHKYGQYIMSCLPKYVQQSVECSPKQWPG
jgi:hypothetical protein